MQESAADSTVNNQGSGDTPSEPLTKYDPVSRSWKTAQLCLTGDLATFSERWPRSGTMRSGIAYQRPTLAPGTSETDYGSWPIYPTPRAQGSNNAGGSNAKKKALRNGVYVTGSLNPAHQEWLMGLPIGHTELPLLATPSYRQFLRSSDAQS